MNKEETQEQLKESVEAVRNAEDTQEKVIQITHQNVLRLQAALIDQREVMRNLQEQVTQTSNANQLLLQRIGQMEARANQAFAEVMQLKAQMQGHS